MQNKIDNLAKKLFKAYKKLINFGFDKHLVKEKKQKNTKIYFYIFWFVPWIFVCGLYISILFIANHNNIDKYHNFSSQGSIFEGIKINDRFSKATGLPLGLIQHELIMVTKDTVNPNYTDNSNSVKSASMIFVKKCPNINIFLTNIADMDDGYCISNTSFEPSEDEYNKIILEEDETHDIESSIQLMPDFLSIFLVVILFFIGWTGFYFVILSVMDKINTLSNKK